MSRCLITGASGFVGSNLAQRLRSDGWEVRCLVRGSSRVDHLQALGVELRRGSLEDAESLAAATAGVDVVFHLAGRTAALRATEFERDNVEGTRRLAAACAAHAQPPVLVMVSSLAAGGPGTRRSPRRESDADRPVSHYGRSKLAAEQAAVAVAGRAPVSIVRPPMVFGQGDRASLQIFRGIKFLPIHPSPGLRRFPVSVIHVRDLCEALVRVAERGERLRGGEEPGEAGRGKYYVAAERTITYGELGRLAGGAAGWAVASLPVPRAIFWFAGSIGEVLGRVRRRPSVINFDKIREATAAGWVCSDEKIRGELGYEPGATLEERFAETVAWYRASGWL